MSRVTTRSPVPFLENGTYPPSLPAERRSRSRSRFRERNTPIGDIDPGYPDAGRARATIRAPAGGRNRHQPGSSSRQYYPSRSGGSIRGGQRSSAPDRAAALQTRFIGQTSAGGVQCTHVFTRASRKFLDESFGQDETGPPELISIPSVTGDRVQRSGVGYPPETGE
jgi:hypothetical protein